ncbi:MAG: hypothetical protein MI806_28375 [Minwuiales bacterium]|nr:hypothetical protein [Minwuiales bacterium]
MPQVTDPRLTATVRLLTALNQPPLPQIEQRRPPVILAPGQPQRALGLLQAPVEQIRTPLPQVQGGFLQPRGGGQVAVQPEAPGLLEQAVGLAGKLGVNKFVSEGLGSLAEQLGIPSFGDIGSSIASAFGFGGAPTVFNTSAAAIPVGGPIAAAPVAGGPAGFIAAASPIGGPIAAAPVAGGPTLVGGTAGAAAAPGLASALFAGPAGFAFPLAAAAIPFAFGALRKLQGSPPSTTTIIGFNDRGRAAVTDADAKGDLTSADAEMLGRRAIIQLNKIRRELGGTFNKDIGDFAVLGSSRSGFRVQDKGRLTRDPNGVTAQFKDPDDAFKAFSLIALREGAINAPQDQINKKIEELSEVFSRSRAIADFGIPESAGGPDFTPPTPQQEFERLSPFNQALVNAQRTGRLAEIFRPGFEFTELPFLAPTPDMTPAQRAGFFAPRFQGGDFSDRADFAAGIGQSAPPPENFDFLLGLKPQLPIGVGATPERLAGMDSFGNPLKPPRSVRPSVSFETMK